MADLAVASSARIDRFPAKAGGEKMRRSLGSKPKPSPPAPATNKVKSLVYQAPPPPPSA
ncbi:unnamed protein product [Spirodela intermedia]|uniref:Uncharacterized protein n=1 Tax=Spirodela intermedia TaxID=51605 RepID=A0A7I8JJH2_SPIIN|nr:unnamed protein product [Spirodela intermedia]CAA6670220.1 unnamed protein product [Spirodela intermedia]